MRSPAKIEDLEWLRTEMTRQYQSAMRSPGPQPIMRLSNLIEWLDIQIGNREQLMTQPRSETHQAMMEAFRGAVMVWLKRREHETMLRPTERAEWEEQHPCPTLKSFMRDQRHRTQQATECQCPIIVEHVPECPLYEEVEWCAACDQAHIGGTPESYERTARCPA